MHPDRPRATRGPVPPAGSVPPTGWTPGQGPFWTVETVDEVRPPLLIDTEASARSSTRVRREFTAWLAIDVTGEPLHDLVLAVYEAVANSAEHAYADHPDGPGPVRVLACRARNVVMVTIADDGVWRSRVERRLNHSQRASRE